MIEIQTKKCAHCGRELPVSEYNHCSVASDGLQSWCRDCSREANRKAWRAKKEKAHQEKKEMERLTEGKVVDPNLILLTRKEGHIAGECEVVPMPPIYPQRTQRREKSEPAKVVKSLRDATPRELMAELKRRGFVWTDMTYTEVHRIEFKNI